MNTTSTPALLKSKFNLKPFCLSTLFVVTSLSISNSANAAGYLFAGEGNGVNVITHPTGYTGTQSTLNVNVCVVPGTQNANVLGTSVENSIRVFNNLVPTTPNLFSANVPLDAVDFESVLLHEIGHCVGLAHTNLGVQTGVAGTNTDYTNSTDGANNAFTFGVGPDGVVGSGDDNRGDDQSLAWFNMANNDPFAIAPIVDSTTFSRLLADLPGSDSYVANASRQVGALLGYPSTEAAMNQGSFFNEAQRTLAADDVHGIALAASGIDELQGTADDYQLVLNYLGISDSSQCDITVEFDTAAAFAFCSVGGVFSGPDHITITSASTVFNPNFNWFFNQVSNVPPPPQVQCNGLAVTVDLNMGQVPTTGNDVILGTPSADIIDARAGNDTICGGGGNDTINAGGGDDVIFGEAGNDVINASAGNDTVHGGAGDDTILAGSGNDLVFGGDGDDVLFGQTGDDELRGQDGIDGINGGSGSDTIFTGAGATVGTGSFVTGSNGNDIITCLLYTSPSPRDQRGSRMPSSA